LEDALDRFEPAPVGDAEWGTSSWGAHGDLSTWSGPAVADMAFATRSGELQTLATAVDGGAGPAAVRELLALQASDWPFMVSRSLAVPYACERFEGHRAALARALAEGPDASEDGLRELARYYSQRIV
jgi:1,4-alpha-glucan branching enzyme